MAINDFGDLKPLTKEYIVDAVNEIDSVQVECVDEDGVLVWDDKDCKTVLFRFLETMDVEALSDLICVSKDIPDECQVDKRALAEYLWSFCDRNAFITLDKLVVIWSEPDDVDTLEPSDFVDEQLLALYEEYSDEYAFEIGQGVLGQLWFERNVAVVNMGEIVRAAREIEQENSDLGDSWFSFENQVEIGFLTTVIHELRHLQLDTNFLLPEDTYPVEWASEEAVEDYCRIAFEESVIPVDLFPKLYENSKGFGETGLHSKCFNGFYAELESLQKELPDASFGFLENTDVGDYYSLYDFLHGHCDEFAAALSDYYGYEIEYIIDSCNTLVHAYCVTEVGGDKAYIDVRGITTDADLFFEEFEAFCTYDKDNGCFYDLSGECRVMSHKDTREMYGDDFRELNQDKDLVQFFKENNSYYSVDVFKRELKQVDNVDDLLASATERSEVNADVVGKNEPEIEI